MSISIIGGKAKGLSLKTPTGDFFRPTLITLKRRYFDWRQNWEGKIFVDLCAGSGSMGIEALSRGAERVLLNEKDRQLFKFLKQNEEAWMGRLKERPPMELFCGSYEVCLQKLDWKEEGLVLFFDPPYAEHELYHNFLRLIPEDFTGEVWLESDLKKGVAPEVLEKHFSRVKKFEQGTSFILGGNWHKKSNLL